MSDAVVFAYSSVGHECLSVLLRRGVNIKLVYTHEDDPNEEHWFDSVYELAKSRNIPVRTDSPEESVVREAKPDVIFSFYYRSMIDMKILDVAPLGAFNMHGSLLPKYRGRACVNWAVLNGETKAGVTLHHMTARADAGNIVGQEAVDIGPDETAHDIFTKIIPAAGRLLERCLDDILSGNAEGTPQDESQATKFGRRTPADGLIDWSKSAREIHNLVRAVAKPFPGAFTYHDGHKIMVWKTRIVDTPPTFGHLPLAEAAGAENYTPPEKGERTTHWRGGQTNCHKLQSAQSGDVRSRRKLGTRALRDRLFRCGSRRNKDRRYVRIGKRRHHRMRKRSGSRLLGRKSQRDTFGERDNNQRYSRRRRRKFRGFRMRPHVRLR